MATLSAQRPASLPPPDLLRRRCDALARLDRAFGPPNDICVHEFDRRRGEFWIREPDGNYVQIQFIRAGVLIVGFHHESPMSPVHNHEQTWPGVVDDVPRSLRPALARYPYGADITFCVWRTPDQGRWQTGSIRRPRGKDADGSQRLLAMLDGNPRRYREYARVVLEKDVPLEVIENAFAGGSIAVSAASIVRASKAVATRPTVKSRFRVGDRVIHPWGGEGTVTEVWNTLAAAAAAGNINDVDGWLRGLSIRPKTPRKGVWYSLRPTRGGSMLVGERDLRPVK